MELSNRDYDDSDFDRDRQSIVLIDLDCFDTNEASMTLLSSLHDQFPQLIMIALTNQNTLTERLAVSRNGGRLLLKKSNSIAQILEAVTQLRQRAFPTPAKILIVDDDIVLLAALVEILQPWGFHVITLAEAHRFWETLEATVPDVLVLDIELPDLSGIELCQVVRSDLRWTNLPVVFMTAHSDAAMVSQVFTAGADDFISKPIVEAEFVARILNRLERVKLIRQLMETDPLTGVANRQKSTQDLQNYLQSADQNHSPMAIAVLDVDHLREFNSAYGYEIGDAILRHFGYQLQQSFCREDIVARWGGGIFLIGMYGRTREEGVERLISVLERLNRQTFTTVTGVSLPITFSSGVSQYPEDGKDIPSLYQAAEAMLKIAKGLRADTIVPERLGSVLPTETII
jgi:diguanylate cyclase (GGDEF)-like protein